MKPRPTVVTPRCRRAAATACVWYLRVMALLNVLAVLSAPLRDRVREHNEGEHFTPYLLTAGLVSAILALCLAVTMRRRKRAAWILNTVLAALTLSVMILWLLVPGEEPGFRHHWINWASAALTALFLLALLVARTEFTSKGDRSNPRTALGTLAGGVLLGGALGVALVQATGTGAGAGLSDRLGYVLSRFVTLDPSERAARLVQVPGWVDGTLNVTAALVFLSVLYVAFRSPRGVVLTEDDEARLRTLLDRHGERDSLGYFALRRDKAAVFSPSGKAAVTYRVVNGVSLASGDPVGDPEAWPGAIDAWLAEARAHAWVPAVMGASEEAGVIYGRHGLSALELGDEAVVEVADFTLEGRAMRGVRQAHNRVRRAGYSVRVRRHGDIPEPEMARLVADADRWRDGATERGFSMALGRLGSPDDGRCVMVECHDAHGELRALLSFVPWGDKGLSLDLMRRDRDSDNGLVEFMVIELLRQADDVGLARVSLNFAMFRSVFERGDRLGAGPVLRLWRTALGFLSRWWQIESLYRANAKYRPVWEPRFVLFRKSGELPRIALAAGRAEGFVTTPGLPALLRRQSRAA
ncbi:phosphatidylglycerol lysyltransferase domain-containing protein [Streptomyces globosus]|uniref:phosphatidylglycerol lysyltransferase domain-containing protein n=1 Tax=Streptomyces globosus TaxID=68209 RepID=UPI001FE3958C|nr:phosphatidylglycerol lysyltransferase domain-containing protein [Streptomyces globosus]